MPRGTIRRRHSQTIARVRWTEETASQTDSSSSDEKEVVDMEMDEKKFRIEKSPTPI